MMVAGSWSNPDHVEMLTKLWSEGQSAAQVANALALAFSDARYSRNAVLGKIHRLGLADAGRLPASKPERAQRVTHARLAPRPTVLKLAGNCVVFHEPTNPRPPRVVIPFRQEAPGLATPMTLQAHQCKWPIGTPGAEDFTHCGRRAPDGPYCASHAEVAYQPREVRKASANELARSLRRYL